MLLIISLFLLFVKFTLCEECILDNSSALNTEIKLHKDLFSKYSAREPPQNTTTVSVHFVLKTFKFDSEEVVFHINGVLFLNWWDPRLKWDPNAYARISETQFDSYRVWIPKIRLIGFSGNEYYHRRYFSWCAGRSSGNITCVLQLSAKTECSTDLSDWPYDVQSCVYKFGIYNTFKDCVVFTINTIRGRSMYQAEYGPGWNIIHTNIGDTASSEPRFNVSFLVEREGIKLAVTVIVPSIVLSALTISSLFLDVGTRFAMTVFSLCGHFYYLHHLGDIIPKRGATTPLVLHYLTISSILTSITLVLSFVLISLRRRIVTPPPWVYAVNELVFTSYGRFLIWPRWEAMRSEPLEDGQNKAIKDWTDFANIINSVFKVIAIIVYFSTFLACIPHKPTLDYEDL